MNWAALPVMLSTLATVDVELEIIYKNTSNLLKSSNIHILITQPPLFLIIFSPKNIRLLSQTSNYYISAIKVFELTSLSFLKSIKPSRIKIKFVLTSNYNSNLTACFFFSPILSVSRFDCFNFFFVIQF